MLGYVEDGAAVQSDAVLGGKYDFAGIDDAGGQAVAVDGFEGRGNLRNIAPECCFWYVIGGGAATVVARCVLQMLLSERLGARKVVSDDDERAVSESSSRKGIVHLDNAAIVDALP